MNDLMVTDNRRENDESHPIRTTVFDLIQELSQLTDDDNLVVAAVKNIFASYRITAVTSAVPVRLFEANVPSHRRPAKVKK